VLFTNAMNEQLDNLRTLRQNLDDAVEAKVREVNSITAQIAQLNRSVVSAESDGHQANDLRDERDMLTSELAKLIEFDVYEQSDGAYTLTLDNKALVFAAESFELETYVNPVSDLYLLDVRWADTKKQIVPEKGELGGILYGRDTTIPAYSDKLDLLSRTLIENVNRLHSQGRGLVGYTSVTGTYSAGSTTDPLDSAGLTFTPGTGSFDIVVSDSGAGTENTYTINVDSSTDSLEDLRDAINAAAGGEITASIDASNRLVIGGSTADKSFVFDGDDSDVLMALGINTFFSGDSGYDISVNATVQSNAGYIAHAQSDAPGDNSNAIAIVQLRDAALMVGNTVTMDKYYTSNIIGDLGSEEREALRMVENQTLIVDQVYDSIDQVSSVSIDEEMADIIQLQHATAAIARYLSVLGDMLDEVINIIR